MGAPEGAGLETFTAYEEPALEVKEGFMGEKEGLEQLKCSPKGQNIPEQVNAQRGGCVTLPGTGRGHQASGGPRPLGKHTQFSVSQRSFNEECSVSTIRGSLLHLSSPLAEVVKRRDSGPKLSSGRLACVASGKLLNLSIPQPLTWTGE